MRGGTALALMQAQLLEKSFIRPTKGKSVRILDRYKSHFRKKPWKRKDSEYVFHMTGELPRSCNSRPIPFDTKETQHIKEMIAGDILEE